MVASKRAAGAAAPALTYIWGGSSDGACTNCGAHGRTDANEWRIKEAVSAAELFLLVYRRWKCRACSKTFSSLDAKFRKTLPGEIQCHFPLANIYKDGYTGRALTPCMVSHLPNAIAAGMNPKYDTIHPSHLDNRWPTFGGTRITGAFIRGLIMVVSFLRKPLDDAFMQSINGRALSCDFCPQIASVLQGSKSKVLAVTSNEDNMVCFGRYYSRGTNSNESINRGIERVLPTLARHPTSAPSSAGTWGHTTFAEGKSDRAGPTLAAGISSSPVASLEREVLAWGSNLRMPQLLFRRDMPKQAFLADAPLELPGSLPYVALRARTALQGLGDLEGEQHIPEKVLISQLRNWQALAGAGTRRPSKAEMKAVADLSLSYGTARGTVKGLQSLGITDDAANLRADMYNYMGDYQGTLTQQGLQSAPGVLLSASGGTGQLQHAAGTPSMLFSASGGSGSFLTGHSVTGVSQDQTTGMNRTAAQEDPVQVNAAGYDNPTEQQPA
ncbi:hypothetical protein WJX77_009688 [Trebouxia sp. C0004]